VRLVHEVVEAIRHADRPMEKIFDQAEAGANNIGWRRLPLSALQAHSEAISDRAIEQLSQKFELCGDLRDEMAAKPEWWAKDNGINARYKTAVEDAINVMMAATPLVEPKAPE
jgi:hypothetical protein